MEKPSVSSVSSVSSASRVERNAARQLLFAQATAGTLERGQNLFHAGEACDTLWLVDSGRLRLVSVLPDGRELVRDVVSAGETIGMALLVDGAAYPYTAQALDDVEYRRVSRQQVLDLVEHQPFVALAILQVMSVKLRQANERNAMLAQKNPLVRLAAFLLERSARLQSESIELTVDDLGAACGMRRETASRKVGELCDLGLVERVGQSGIRIVDKAGLQRLAGRV